MRLVDVDKFLERVKKDREHEIYLHSWTADMVLERLDSWYAPTVEAIPKERIEQILSKIPNLAHYESPDGQDLVMVSDVMRLIKQTTDPLAQSLVSYCQKIVDDYEKEHQNEP